MAATKLSITESENCITFKVKVVPGSSQTAICGLYDDMIKIKVSAPPEKGKANKCLIEFLSKKLGVKKNAVSVITGATGPVKQIHITGLSPEILLKKLTSCC